MYIVIITGPGQLLQRTSVNTSGSMGHMSPYTLVLEQRKQLHSHTKLARLPFSETFKIKTKKTVVVSPVLGAEMEHQTPCLLSYISDHNTCQIPAQ